MEEYNYKSTITSMKRFLDNPGFEVGDVNYEINAMIKDASRGMESIDDIYEMCRFQGRVQALRAVLEIPRNILEALEEDAQRELPDEPEGDG